MMDDLYFWETDLWLVTDICQQHCLHELFKLREETKITKAVFSVVGSRKLREDAVSHTSWITVLDKQEAEK